MVSVCVSVYDLKFPDNLPHIKLRHKTRRMNREGFKERREKKWTAKVNKQQLSYTELLATVLRRRTSSNDNVFLVYFDTAAERGERREQQQQSKY